MLIARVQTCYHQAEAVSTKTLSQKTRQLRISIRHIIIIIVIGFCQGSDNLSECHKTFVNLNTFFRRNISCLALTFRTSQIN